MACVACARVDSSQNMDTLLYVDFEIYSKICEDHIYICLPYMTNIIPDNIKI